MAQAAKSNLTPQQARTLKNVANKYNVRTAEADALREQLDALVLDARESKGTFREIAALASRSVAWVQGSLVRSQKRAAKTA